MDFIVAFLELMEAEGRSLRRAVVSVAWQVALMTVAAIVLLVGVVLLGRSLYGFLAASLSPDAAFALVGSLAILLGGGVLWKLYRNDL
ncbi:MAG: hypothetical protein KDI19_15835 [Pseudomonadales bacterium]|nr:hypothetical protein [Pseudomonadales bacterium]